MARMSDDELITAVEALEEDSYGFDVGVLAQQREDAINAFTGQTLIEAAPGRSSVNSSTFRDTYLWIQPQLLRTFLGSDRVVQFDPQGREDEEAAKQETEVVGWIVERSNPFIQFSAMFQDAMLLGNGYGKVWWHKDESVQIERYMGKSDDELAMLMQDTEVEVTEHTQYPDPEFPAGMPGPDGQPMPPQMLHDVVLRRKVVDEYAKFEAVPAEEIKVSKHARGVSLQDVQFVEHRRRLTISELRQMGYDVPDDIQSWYDDEITMGVTHARDRWAEDQWKDEDKGLDPSARRVTYREAYPLLDANGDGKAERLKVCIVGRKVLHKEETDMVPIVSISPILFAHRHIGLSLWDLMKELEALRTTILRSYLDGLYLSLNSRTAIDAKSVNIDDMLISRPGGIVRTMGTPTDKIMPLPVLPVGQTALEGLNLLDQWKQDATGVSAMFQGGPGLDASQLNGQTASGISQVISQAQMRIESIARSFADTGIKDLFLLLHHLTLKHSRKALTVKLRNAWTLVDPRTWRKRNVVTAQVALGAGTKEMRAAQLQQLIALQLQLAPAGVATPDKLYASFARLCNELGYKNADEFASNPAQQPPQEPPVDPLVQAQQIKSQTDMQIKQAELQSRQGEAGQKFQMEQAAMQADMQRKAQEAQINAELEREKARIASEKDITVARIKAEIDAQTQLQIEQIRAQGSGLSAENSAMHEQHQSGMQQLMQMVAQVAQTVQSLAGEHARKQNGKVVRDPKGRVAGLADANGQLISLIERDQHGRVAGVKPPDSIQ